MGGLRAAHNSREVSSVNVNPWGARVRLSLSPAPTFDEWAECANRLLLPASIGSVHDAIDLYLSGLRFLHPLDVCAARLTIQLASLASDSVTVHVPADIDVHTYGTRLDLYADLPENVTLTNPPVRMTRSNHRQRLIELTSIHTSSRLLDFEDHVGHVAEGISRAHRRLFRHGLVEAAENVIDHAASPVGALVSAQRYSDRLEIAVVDAGRGIHASLTRRRKYQELSESQAIAAVLEEGATRRVGSGGGGIRQLTELVNGHRNAVIELGSGRVAARISGLAGPIYRNPSSPIPGTWLTLTLR